MTNLLNLLVSRLGLEPSPCLKSSNHGVLISARYCNGFPNFSEIPALYIVLSFPYLLLFSIPFPSCRDTNGHSSITGMLSRCDDDGQDSLPKIVMTRPKAVCCSRSQDERSASRRFHNEGVDHVPIQPVHDARHGLRVTHRRRTIRCMLLADIQRD